MGDPAGKVIGYRVRGRYVLPVMESEEVFPTRAEALEMNQKWTRMAVETGQMWQGRVVPVVEEEGDA